MKIDKNKISYNALDSQLIITNINDNIFNGHKYSAPNLKSGVIKEANISYINNNVTTNVIIPINKSFNFNNAFIVDVFLDQASIGPLGQGALYLSIDEYKSKLSLTLTDNTILKATLDKCYYITGGTSWQNIIPITSSNYSTYFTNFYFVIETDGNNDHIVFSDDVHINGNLAIDKCIGTLIKQDNNKQTIYDNIPVEYNHLYYLVATHKTDKGIFNHHYLYLHNTHDPGRSTCTANLFAITSNTSKQDANDGPSVCMILNDDTRIKVKIHYTDGYSIDTAISLDRFTSDTDDNHCTQCLTVYDLGIYLGVDRQLNP